MPSAPLSSAEDRPWIDHVIALERRLLQPSVRSDPHEVAPLLDPEFHELGVSGQVWDRDGIIVNLSQQPGSTRPIRDEEMLGRVLADGLVLLTYVSDSGGRRALRSSLWRRDEAAGWRMLHHQGTPMA